MKKIKLCCVGRRRGHTGKVFMCFFIVDETNKPLTEDYDCDEKLRYYELKPRVSSKFTIGNIYEFESKEDKSIIVNSSKFINHFSDENKIASWHIADLAVRSEVSLKNKEKTGIHEIIEKTLKPLRQRYYETDSLGKIAIEIAVLNYMRRGRG